ATSRLHDNVHFASDVVFGAAVGVIVGRSVTWHGRNDYRITLVPMGEGLGAGITWWPGAVGRGGRAGDFSPLGLEGGDPLIGADLGVAGEAADLEEIVELLIRQLREQVGQELAAGFVNHRVVDRAGPGPRQVADAARAVFPHLDRRPVLVVRAAWG